jgi:hypothetical protein
MARRIALIIVWTAAFFIAGLAVVYLLLLGLFSIIGREDGAVAIGLTPFLFVLVIAATVSGAVLGFSGRLPGTGRTTHDIK